jgi:hypothetical protein
MAERSLQEAPAAGKAFLSTPSASPVQETFTSRSNTHLSSYMLLSRQLSYNYFVFIFWNTYRKKASDLLLSPLTQHKYFFLTLI